MKTEIVNNDYGIFECFTNDKHITKHIKENKIFHPKLYSWIKNNLEGDFIDIGANIGCYSIIASKEFPQYNTYSVEAHPEIYKVLSNNKNLNNLNNMFTYNFAALDRSKQCSMAALQDYKDFNTGDMRISENDLSHVVDGCRCDEIINNIQCSVIKIDAQGSDYEALLGCEKIIDIDRPTIIIEWEQNMVTTKVSFSDVSNYLEKFGYKITDQYMRDVLFTNSRRS